jgi:hypothetical protein
MLSHASFGPQEVRLLSDTPLDDDAGDVFGFGALADALAELIDGERTAAPLTLAISAPWAPARDHDVWISGPGGERPSVEPRARPLGGVGVRGAVAPRQRGSSLPRVALHSP